MAFPFVCACVYICGNAPEVLFRLNLCPIKLPECCVHHHLNYGILIGIQLFHTVPIVQSSKILRIETEWYLNISNNIEIIKSIKFDTYIIFVVRITNAFLAKCYNTHITRQQEPAIKWFMSKSMVFLLSQHILNKNYWGNTEIQVPKKQSSLNRF